MPWLPALYAACAAGRMPWLPALYAACGVGRVPWLPALHAACVLLAECLGCLPYTLPACCWQSASVACLIRSRQSACCWQVPRVAGLQCYCRKNAVGRVSCPSAAPFLTAPLQGLGQAQCGLERPTFGGLWMCSAEPTDAQTSFSTKAGMKNVHPHWFSTAKAMVAKHASFRQAMSTISYLLVGLDFSFNVCLKAKACPPSARGVHVGQEQHQEKNQA
eukprot:1159202-Pelagomonas_calceolata.AAC.16